MGAPGAAVRVCPTQAAGSPTWSAAKRPQVILVGRLAMQVVTWQGKRDVRRYDGPDPVFEPNDGPEVLRAETHASGKV